ncbi:MAG TPA: succinate dehydrogenase, hydrophobic membrane anchor protein [Xanthomonadales bacterium]|nr:succinate dehydrogenase, hydrophobic membrane anchor protein [Xanthomonadales bacterium]
MSGHGNGQRHPLAHARGLGSAKEGSQHWWAQRVSAVALAVLSPWFVLLAIELAGSDRDGARTLIAEPITATLLIAWVLALFWHARLGVQVVIEDYIHQRGLELALQLVVRFVFALAAIAAVLAIARIVFSA